MRKIFPMFKKTFNTIKFFAVATVHKMSGAMRFSNVGEIDNKGDGIKAFVFRWNGKCVIAEITVKRLIKVSFTCVFRPGLGLIESYFLSLQSRTGKINQSRMDGYQIKCMRAIKWYVFEIFELFPGGFAHFLSRKL